MLSYRGCRTHGLALAQAMMLRGGRIAAAAALAWLACHDARAQEGLGPAERALAEGRYREALALSAARQSPEREKEALLVQARAHFAIGEYRQAGDAVMRAWMLFSGDPAVEVVAWEIFPYSGHLAARAELFEDLSPLVGPGDAPLDAAGLVAKGRALLLRGTDARIVLDHFYAPARKLAPKAREPILAIGELALEKADYAFAAETFREGLKLLPDDPGMLHGLARSIPDEPPAALERVEKALAASPSHLPSLLLAAELYLALDREKEAREAIDAVLAVNPSHPEAWALQAAMALKDRDTESAEEFRAKALQFWAANPAVDHLIGEKLSQDYQFAAGAERQRQALKFQPDYLPAKIALALDLLRLGREPEGMRLARDVFAANPYSVTAYNLVTLEEKLVKFATLRGEGLVVRMDPREARIYGPRAVALLDRARAKLTKKYGVTLEQDTTVEIFPDQKDFGVRTFGIPGGEGFLGVCFGPVITAVSPGGPSATRQNWEAVLWHELAHTITLAATGSRIPRWLTEGMSVWEEIQENPGWGRGFSPAFRQMILDGKAAPLAELDVMFKKGETIQFAYFQASLAVEFLVEKYGFAALRGVLAEIKRGAPIGEALASKCAPMEQVEEGFAAFAKKRAEAFAPMVDWSAPPELMRASEAKLADFLKDHPDNYAALTRRARLLIAAKEWGEAAKVAQHLVAIFPDNRDDTSGHALLAEAHRGAGDTARERAALMKLAELNGEAASTFVRLMEIGAESRDWALVRQNAERLLAVNPMLPESHRHLALAAEAQKKPAEAIAALRAVLALEPRDAGEVHYRLARLLGKGAPAEAKRHVLQALEGAPRYREAHALLLELAGGAQ